MLRDGVGKESNLEFIISFAICLKQQFWTKEIYTEVIKGERIKEPGDFSRQFRQGCASCIDFILWGCCTCWNDFFAKYGVKITPNSFRFQMITLGGDAELELVDSLDPFSEGVVFSVRPPKKSWKNIANLSGGEKVFSIIVALSECSVYFLIVNHCL